MTTTQCIRDAADPLATALVSVYEAGIRVPPTDILISWTAGGCVMRVADRSSTRRDEIEEAFRTAFLAAGWGVRVRNTGGLNLEHPSTLTRL
ncbi:hypothetical protein AB0H29_08405 [Streptomyces thermolilacinus]